jgi:hypothetical protein
MDQAAPSSKAIASILDIENGKRLQKRIVMNSRGK